MANLSSHKVWRFKGELETQFLYNSSNYIIAREVENMGVWYNFGGPHLWQVGISFHPLRCKNKKGSAATEPPRPSSCNKLKDPENKKLIGKKYYNFIIIIILFFFFNSNIPVYVWSLAIGG
jgi:hypothetical protein